MNDNFTETYNNIKETIESYISKRELELNRLNLRKERIQEEIESLPTDFATKEDVVDNYNQSSRQDVIDLYNKELEEIDKEINNIIDPSKEQLSNVLEEILTYNQQINTEKRNIDDEISNLNRSIRRLQFEISEWHYDRKPLDSEYYKLANELEDINNKKRRLEILKEEYDKLISNLKNYEEEVFKNYYERINSILNNTYEDDIAPEKNDELEQPDNQNKISDDTKTVPGEDLDDEETLETEDKIEVPENISEEIDSLEEYKMLLDIYNEDLEKLYELQESYENNGKKYEEYSKYADYIIERYNYLVEKYITILNSVLEKKNEYSEYSDEELVKLIENLNKQIEEIYHDQVHVSNGEIPDDSLDVLNKKIRQIKEELENRKKIKEIPLEPMQPMMILEQKKKTIDDRYSKYIDEYNNLLEMYKEDLEKLYELQLDYEKEENTIKKSEKYTEYSKYADYMLGRYKFIKELYEKILNLYTNEKLLSLSTEELEKELEQLENEYDTIYNQQVHVENAENPDNSIDIINEKIKLIKEELEKRKIGVKREQPEEPIEPAMIMEIKKTPIPPEPPIEKQENFYTLEGIIEKIIGEEAISKGQAKKYMASQIKIYNKLPKNDKLGNPYKLVSIPKKIMSVVMIPFNGLKKLIGKITTKKETKESVRRMKERINELSDEEIEIFLNEYKGSRSLGFRLPKLFNELMSERIVRYLQGKISKINNRIAELLVEIDYRKKLIDDIYNKINSGNLTEEEKNAYIEEYYKANKSCSDMIKEMYNLRKEGNNLVSGNGLHSLEEELKASNTKMNYHGGRFSSNREIDPVIWKKLGETSRIIEYSNNPQEVVKAYFEQKDLYIDNTKEKRTVRNLFSKTTVGKLDYRPFVEIPYYGNDPFVSYLISSILMVSTAVTLANNIITNINNAGVNKAIEDANKAINDNNAQIAGQNQLRNDVINGGDTIANDTIYGINKTPNDVLNIGERGNNDFHNYRFTQSHQAEDALIHADATNLEIYNKQVISDLTNQYNSGIIEMPEYIRKLSELKEHNNNIYNGYLSKYEQTFTDYSASHPQYDYTVIFEALKNVPNATSSIEMSNYLSNIYEQAYSMMDLNNISLINQVVSSPSLIAPIIATTAAATKLVDESTKDYEKTEMKNYRSLRTIVERMKNRYYDDLDYIEEIEEDYQRTL